jgi:butyryl-CoA dehydrogenase
MLLRQKAISEGGFALAIEVARLVDVRAHAEDATQRDEAGALLDLLTPVVKAWSAQWGCVANDLAIQVLGGYGYTREFPVEQLWRDNRLNPIHEGANGIQALDLLGRKLMQADGAGWRALQARVAQAIAQARALPALAREAEALAEYAAVVELTATALLRALGAGEVSAALAQASPFLDLVGHLCVGWTWLRMATLAQAALDAGSGDAAFARGKLAACRHFLHHELPPVAALAPGMQALATPMLAIGDDEW